jgi:integrase
MSKITQVDFQQAPRKFESLGAGLYREQRSAAFYERPYVDGKQTWRKLDATTERQARIELGKKRAEQAQAKHGLATDPYRRNDALTIKDLAEFYLAGNCPKRNEQPRTGKQLKEEKGHVRHIIAALGRRPWTAISLEECRSYHAARTKQIRRGRGDRTVDIELRCLSSIFRWAMRNAKRTGVTANPIAHERMRFCQEESVRHCRDVMPESADELHAIARYLFTSPHSEVLGWQALGEAMIGQRSAELLKLRWDAKTEFEPGYIRDNCLFLYRSRTSKGTYPYCQLFPELADYLRALRAWRDKRYPNSPWFFPSHIGQGREAVSPTALTHALRRITPAMGLPHRTSHGLRAFWVSVIRSFRRPDGTPVYSDAEIALRAGHRSGGKLIVQVYGEILPYALSWLPKEGPPAWSAWLPKAPPAEGANQMEFTI